MGDYLVLWIEASGGPYGKMMIVTKYDGSLADLMRAARERVYRATDLISSFDDVEVIDREMRYIRPFWEFINARQRLGHAKVWQGVPGVDSNRNQIQIYRKTALAWLPERQSFCDAFVREPSELSTRRILRLLRGSDLVIYNFIRLLARMRFTFGVEDSDNFTISTKEKNGGNYRIQLRRLRREAKNGEFYSVTTCQFMMADGEAIKIERDTSKNAVNPHVSLTLHNIKIKGERRLLWDGMNSDLKAGKGGRLHVR